MQRVQSSDSTYNIRKNPLNIRNFDGTDLVMASGKNNAESKQYTESRGIVKQGQATPRSANQPALRRPQSAVLVSPQKAEMMYDENENEGETLDQVPQLKQNEDPFVGNDLLPAHARRMISSGVTPLVGQEEEFFGASGQKNKDFKLDDMGFDSPDLSCTVLKSYNALRDGVKRQNTIQSRNSKVKTSESKAEDEAAEQGEEKENQQPAKEKVKKEVKIQQPELSPRKVRSGGNKHNEPSPRKKPTRYDRDPKDLGSTPMMKPATDDSSSESNAPSLHTNGEEESVTDVSSVETQDSQGHPKQQQKASSKDEKRSRVDSHDRGRLFLKIGALKDLKLPTDPAEKPQFTLSLDNGLQCVTTYPMSLENGMYINQEFELVVGEDLQLMVTLSGQRTIKDAQAMKALKADTQKPTHKKQAKSQDFQDPDVSTEKRKVFSKLFTSPRKKKKADDEDEDSQGAAPTLKLPPRKRDVWRGVVGPNGEFARAYVVLSQVEKEVFGKPKVYNLTCYNDWNYKEENSNARVCGLQVTLMYLPKAYKEETLPTSLEQGAKMVKAAQAQRTAEDKSDYSGFLSQQGGDCLYLRRRYFVLNRVKNELVGYHDETREKRQRFSMSEVVSITDSKCDPSVFEPRVFKMSFKDGTDIRFYSDTVENKEKWFNALQQQMKPHEDTWLEVVLANRSSVKKELSETRKKWASQEHLANKSSFVEKL